MDRPETLSRRSLLFAGASAALVSNPLRSVAAGTVTLNVSGLPDSAVVFTEAGRLTLQKNQSTWQAEDIELRTILKPASLDLQLSAPRSAVIRIHLRWQTIPPTALQYLGDHWERSYGDLSWRSLEPERVMPWYFLATDGHSTFACGVKTAASAFCFWQVDPAGVSLWLDVRNGGRGVQLGARELHLASVITRSYPATKPFTAARSFCHLLSPSPRLPTAPVYGGNNWYYAYGHSSSSAILADSERMASFAGSARNRPFMVIDDGWQPNPTAGPWTQGNVSFPDMPQLASKMRALKVKPGLWTRPLFTKETIPSSWVLSSPNAAREFKAHLAFTLDPTVPEALARCQQDLRTVAAWGFGLVKHDFSTYDLLGRWGSKMEAEITEANWSFSDRTLTNAEVILNFYKALRQAAGETLLLGCNTVGHLAAGLFELQRTGDDTSGRDWNRTRKMGINTLAFRAPQHGAFFAIDADCVGITRQIPWKLNRQWLDLLARSGTPLFVSAAPDSLDAEQLSELRQAFSLAANPGPLLEPLDWLTNNQPKDWLLKGQTVSYDWFGTDGASPFAS